MKKLRPRLTFANVVSCLALFVALGGSAYAAAQLPKNSVGTKQLKTGAVTVAKLASSVQGERGPEGKQGPKGDPGGPGKSAATKAVVRRGELGYWEGEVKFEPGEIATGGGGLLGVEEADAYISYSAPVQNSSGVPIGWKIAGSTPEGEPGLPEAFAVCVSP